MAEDLRARIAAALQSSWGTARSHREQADEVIRALGLTAQYSHDCGVTRYRERPPWWADMKSRQVRYVTDWADDDEEH